MAMDTDVYLAATSANDGSRLDFLTVEWLSWGGGTTAGKLTQHLRVLRSSRPVPETGIQSGRISVLLVGGGERWGGGQGWGRVGPQFCAFAKRLPDFCLFFSTDDESADNLGS